MFLLPTLAFAVLLALLLGGRPARLLDVRFRHGWTVYCSLAIQLVLFLRVSVPLDPVAERGVHVATYALLFVFALANLHLRTLIPAYVGMALNAFVIAVNGGEMPLSSSAAEAAGLNSANSSANVSFAAERMWFLGDVFAMPGALPWSNVFSIGDVLLACGVVAFVVVVSTTSSARPSLDLGRVVAPLGVAAYRRLAAARVVSHLGDWLTLAALVGWIYERTNSVAAAAALLLTRLAPPILGGGIAAVVVDRASKARLLVAVETGRAVAVAIALVGVLTGNLVIVFVSLAVSGLLATLSGAIVPALLPALVPSALLAPANAGLGVAKDGAMAVGAAGAGIALASVGPAVALAADLATFVVAVAVLATIPRSVPMLARTKRQTGASGLRYLLSHRSLLLFVFAFAAATLATGMISATLPAFLGNDVGFGASGYAYGIAALAGGLAVGQLFIAWTPFEHAERWVACALLVMALLVVLLALGDHASTALLVLGAIGFADGTTDVLFETAVQREAEPAYYGAIFGFASAAMMTTMLGGVSVAPLVHEFLRTEHVLLVASVALVLAAVIAFRRVYELRSRPENTGRFSLLEDVGKPIAARAGN